MNRLNQAPSEVVAAFEKVQQPDRDALLDVREMIFEVAKDDPRVGNIEEALRWGEPAYLTNRTKAGSTIRLGIEKGSGKPAMFFNCQTALVEEFRQQFGSDLRYSKNRAVILDGKDDPNALRICIAAALTYHCRGKA